MTDDEIKQIKDDLAKISAWPWQWVDGETDEPCSPEKPCQSGEHDEYAYGPFSLRSVEQFEVSIGGTLPRFVIHHAEEFGGYESEPNEWVFPDAEFIAAAPETIAALLAEVENLRKAFIASNTLALELVEEVVLKCDDPIHDQQLLELAKLAAELLGKS